MIKFKTAINGSKMIVVVNAEKESKNYIWVDGLRIRKLKHENFFDSFQEAKQYLLSMSMMNIERYESYIKEEKNLIEKITCLSE